uniref:Lipase n=1 Tax=Vombatus ursinus TaxID=29139 RepID=A0A4X2K541_VOMUR
MAKQIMVCECNGMKKCLKSLKKILFSLQSEMVTYWGYPSEDYEVMTEDGYILGVYRTPYGKNHTNNSAQRPVVFLQHGLLTSASSWISNLPSNSLAFTGCDVWLGNSRGNAWSSRHSFLSVNSDQFWAFSFDEMATYDLPATIDFIGRKTGQKEMYYIGHSQGTTVGVISTLPRLAQRIKIFFALAPVITIQHTKKFIHNTLFNRFIGTKLCSIQHLDSICRSFLFMLCGFDFINLNMVSRMIWMRRSHYIFFMDFLLKTAFCFNSANQLSNKPLSILPFLGEKKQKTKLKPNHIIQRLQPFPTSNWVFSIDKHVPTAAWNGGQDLVADPEDAKSSLPQILPLIYHKMILCYSRLDFIWGIDAPWAIYYEIINMIKKAL